MPGTLINNTWALASLSVSNMRATPDHTTELVSQVLMGTPLQVLEFRDKFYRVQTPENYSGWLDAKGLQLLSEEEMRAWKNSQRCFYNEISGLAFDAPDIEGEVVTDLILGDLFEVESDVNGYWKIKLPDGRGGYVRQDDCISFEDWIALEPDVPPVLTFAKKLMGTPYLWGGASAKASDCSGFTKMLFYTRGIILARDASQQAKYGEAIDISRIENLEPGDLLFFGVSAERISHVGIYLGNGDFIHSSGRVHISSIIPGDPKHDPNRNFVAARRIVNSIDNEGITRVKNHPWFNIG
jgi:gamma-D-glutamyl-L-lysine dipeptidyl-peptidase